MQENTPRRRTVYAAAVLLLFCYFMVWEVNFYLAETLKTTYYMMCVPALTAGVLYFRRLRDGIEYKLLLAYWLWVWFSRVLCGDPALRYDFQLVFDLALMLPFFALGLTLDARQRRRFLDWFSAAVGGWYFLVGVFCLIAFIQRKLYVNPITEGHFGMNAAAGWSRINVFDTNPDASAYWFMMPLFLMVYQFFACCRRLWRVPIVLAALVYYAVIAITYTRSVMLASALGLGLLAAMLAARALNAKARALRAGAALLSLLLVLSLTYRGFTLVSTELSRLSYRLHPYHGITTTERVPTAAKAPAAARPVALAAAESAPAPAEAPAPSPGGLWERLDRLSSHRLGIWRGALLALREDPAVLLRGQLVKDMMTLSNRLTGSSWVHYHNVLVQVLMFSGLPGMLLILALLLLLFVKGLRFLFSGDPRAPLAEKTLVLPVLGCMLYYMLENGAFTRCDVRPLYFYLLCGMMLGAVKAMDNG